MLLPRIPLIYMIVNLLPGFTKRITMVRHSFSHPAP